MTFKEVRARSDRINAALMKHPELNRFIYKRECELREMATPQEMEIHANRDLLDEFQTEHTTASLVHVQAGRRHGWWA